MNHLNSKAADIKTAKRLGGVEEYYFSQKLREIEQLNREGKAVINLGIGSPDLPPHPSVIAALQEASSLKNVHGYQSYKGSPVLRNAISAWYKKWYAVNLDPQTEILPLMGSKEGIMHICMTYLDEGDIAMIPDPGYPTYSSAVKLSGGTPITYSLSEKNNWAPDYHAIRQTIHLNRQKGHQTKLLFVNYPHMPTGQKAGHELFHELLVLAREEGLIVVHDNPYSFILNDEPESLLSLPGALDVVIELNSLSKSHNMAGWRIGMLCAKAERINEVLRFKSNMDSGMFLPMQLAAAKALELGEDWFRELNKTYQERRDKVFQLLDLLGCNYSTQQVGLFVWAGIPGHINDGYELSDLVLNKASVFITPGGIFGAAGSKYVRVSLCTPVDQIEIAKERITKAVKIHE